MKAVIILSGGMDSTTLLYDAIKNGWEVYALTFNYKQRHEKEIRYAMNTCRSLKIPHKIIAVPSLQILADSTLTRPDRQIPEGHYEDANMKQTVVPNRNMVLIALAVSFAISIKADTIIYGAHAGDHAIYPDCRPEFIDALQEAISLCDWKPPKLHAPYQKITKGEIALKGKRLKVDYSKTWTCYNGRQKACGRCGACTERLEAFAFAGMKDPLEYEVAV